jgi:hypothetical protein
MNSRYSASSRKAASRCGLISCWLPMRSMCNRPSLEAFSRSPSLLLSRPQCFLPTGGLAVLFSFFTAPSRPLLLPRRSGWRRPTPNWTPSGSLRACCTRVLVGTVNTRWSVQQCACMFTGFAITWGGGGGAPITPLPVLRQSLWPTRRCPARFLEPATFPDIH